MKLQLSSHNVFHVPQNDESNALPLSTRSLSDIPTIVQRSASSSTSASAGKTPAQEESSTNLIIGLSVAIPIGIAIVVLIYLHTRIKRKQRQEDARDPHRSLDFGLDDVVTSKKGGKGGKVPEMAVTDMEKQTMAAVRSTHGKGLSLDIMTPYLLPAAVNDSRESLHSMSRSLRDGDDPYRPVTIASRDSPSTRSAPRLTKNDNESVYTASSIPSGDAMNASLIKNASRMSRSDPFEDGDGDSSPQSVKPPQFQQQVPPQQNKAFPPRNASNKPPAPVVQVTEVAAVLTPPAPRQAPAPAAPRQAPAPAASRHPAAQRPNIPAVNVDLANDPASFEVTPPSPPPPAIQEPAADNNRLSTVQPDARRVSVMGLRPLPPDDPADNPEQRANRIRSFYKEYFDDSKPNPAGYYPEYNPYAEDFTAEYYDDGMYDPAMAAPPAPFAQPMERRAFTPPPGGAAPRFRPRANTSSMQSTGHIDNPAFRGPRQPPMKKPIPAPSPLKSLPTPAKLNGDDCIFLNPTDFAPLPTYRDERLGRGRDSPLGTVRPYSPAVQAFSPLVKSFDDLAPMPSPHLLRKSGTFTSLDFAPPPRFRQDGGNASDSGSIRSNRSGISQMHNQAIRTGAYRISRLPPQMVGTRDDLAMALKPSWTPGSTG